VRRETTRPGGAAGLSVDAACLVPLIHEENTTFRVGRMVVAVCCRGRINIRRKVWANDPGSPSLTADTAYCAEPIAIKIAPLTAQQRRWIACRAEVCVLLDWMGAFWTAGSLPSPGARRHADTQLHINIRPFTRPPDLCVAESYAEPAACRTKTTCSAMKAIASITDHSGGGDRQSARCAWTWSGVKRWPDPADLHQWNYLFHQGRRARSTSMTSATALSCMTWAPP